MSSAANRLRLGALRAATLTDDGEVVPLPWLVAGTLTWPAGHAHRVLHALARLARGRGPADRLHRPPAAGRRAAAATVAIEVALPGGPAEAARRLAPLRALDPGTDTVSIAGPELLRPALTAVPAGFEPFSAHLRLAALTADGVDALLAAAGPGSRARRCSPPSCTTWRARSRSPRSPRPATLSRPSASGSPSRSSSAGWLPGPPDPLRSRPWVGRSNAGSCCR